jgi:hypothetical protein
LPFLNFAVPVPAPSSIYSFNNTYFVSVVCIKASLAPRLTLQTVSSQHGPNS